MFLDYSFCVYDGSDGADFILLDDSDGVYKIAFQKEEDADTRGCAFNGPVRSRCLADTGADGSDGSGAFERVGI